MPRHALSAIFEQSSPFLHVTGLVTPTRLWLRDVGGSDSRRGPWKAGTYRKLDEATWSRKGSCIYIVQSSDGGFRYVGVSNKGVTQRWREAPAVDPATQRELSMPHIFHRPCWKNIQRELESSVSKAFEIRAAFAPELRTVLSREKRAELHGLSALPDAELVNQAEVWFRAHRDRANPLGFLGWNKR